MDDDADDDENSNIDDDATGGSSSSSNRLVERLADSMQLFQRVIGQDYKDPVP